jgi:hypothetical protein
VTITAIVAPTIAKRRPLHAVRLAGYADQSWHLDRSFTISRRLNLSIDLDCKLANRWMFKKSTQRQFDLGASPPPKGLSYPRHKLGRQQRVAA